MSDPYAAALGLADSPPASAKEKVPSSVAARLSFSPADAASAAATNHPSPDDGFAKAYANASPADKADLLRSRTMTADEIAGKPQRASAAANDPYAEGLGLDASGKPARSVAPAAQAMPAKSAAGADPKSDALYAETGSGDYTRPGESWWDAYSRNSTYDQQQRDAGNRHAADPMKIAASAATGVVGSIAGGLKGLYTTGKSLYNGDSFETAAGKGADAVTSTQQALTYVPDDPESRAVSGMASGGANPLNWPAMAGDYAGGKLGEAGYPTAGAAVATAGAAVPMLLGAPKVRTGIADTAGAARSTLGDLTRPPAAPVPRVEPALESNPSPTLSQVAPGVPEANLSLAPRATVPDKSAPFPGGSAPTTPAPKPTFSDPANNVFADSAPDVKGGIPAAEQTRRQAVLQEIGLNQVRRSAITGDASQAAVDFQTSRLKGSPGGDAMSQQLATEKQTIADYADNITQKTGGSARNDQNAKLARGEAILTPLEGLKEWFDNQTSALYKTADERAQGVPTNLDNFRSVLGDDSLATNSDRVNLRTAAGAYAKKLGIIDDEGKVFANAQQAETMRKYLNENWSPQNSGLVGKLKDALDQDVMSAAGEDVYGQARALRSQRAATLDNPNGIAKLLDSSGPQGVNRAVPVEKVADALTNMPVAQLHNIVETLKNMPPELQPMAQDALAEIKAQYAHNVKDIGASQQGQWNAKGVQKYLSNNSARMMTVFEPDEMKSFGTLNDAGNILAKDQSYPGAYAQQQNLIRAGVSHAISAGSTAAGATIAGPLGAAVGNVLGGKMAGSFNDASTLRATQKRMVTLSNLTSGGSK